MAWIYLAINYYLTSKDYGLYWVLRIGCGLDYIHCLAHILCTLVIIDSSIVFSKLLLGSIRKLWLAIDFAIYSPIGQFHYRWHFPVVTWHHEA